MVWVDAPPKRWGPRKKPILTPEKEARLRANPGRWAQVETFDGPSSAHQARKRWTDNPQHVARDEWEFEARKFTDNTSALYGRYVGPAVEVEVDEEIVEQVPPLGLDGESSPDAGDEALDGSDFSVPEEPAPRLTDEDEDDDEAYEEQVGVINGVCGPCRRLRCYLCQLDACKCARPNHFAQTRTA